MVAQENFKIVALVDVLPAWLIDKQAVGAMLHNLAKRGVAAYVAVPPATVVVEQALIRTAPGVEQRATSIGDDRERRRTGEVIDAVLILRGDVLLELTADDLQELCARHHLRRHWFQGGVAASSEDSTYHQLPNALRCLRPSGSFQRPHAAKTRPAVRYDEQFDHQFTFDDVYVRAPDADLLRMLALPPAAVIDPHGLAIEAPAVFQLYAAARDWGDALGKIERSRAANDREKLRQAKLSVAKFLGKLRGPFKTKEAKHQAFRIIDPRQSWGKGPKGTCFDAAIIEIEGHDRPFAVEGFVTKPLQVIIFLALETIKERQRHGDKWRTPTAEVQRQLRHYKFTGDDLIKVVTAILRFRARVVPKPKTKP